MIMAYTLRITTRDNGSHVSTYETSARSKAGI